MWFSEKNFSIINLFCSIAIILLSYQSLSAQDSLLINLQNSTESKFNKSENFEFYQTAGQPLGEPLRVRVVDTKDKPVFNWPVYFSIITLPQKSDGTSLKNNIVYTDTLGYAETNVILGSKEGIYEFSARIYNTISKNDIIYYKVNARKSNWVFFLVTGLIGGLGLFLFGMEMMSNGLKKTAGNKLRSILSKITNNRIIAVGIGTFVTMIIQSSSATTVMLVSFVQAKLMTFTQTLGIILGAGIGTSVTAQLIALKLTDYALLFVGFGFALVFITRSKKIKNVGESILGFGLLFFGMYIMSEAMYPLRTYTPFIDSLLKFENPVLGILVGTIFTALIQSSSAFIGILIVLASQGLLTLEAGIPLLIGSNIGTSVTAILASLKTSREAKRVAMAHTIFKSIGVLIFIWWLPTFAEVIRYISPGASGNLLDAKYLGDVVPRQIANAHTLFNIAIMIMVLPLTNLFAKLFIKILPDKAVPEKHARFHVRFLEDNLISTPALALNLAKAEIIEMMEKVQLMVGDIIKPFTNNEIENLKEIQLIESEVDFLQKSINSYLTKISQQSLPKERIDEVFQMMHTVTELEHIGDVVSRDLRPLAKKKINLELKFSDEGRTEIIDYHSRTMKQISRAIEVFKDVNLEDAAKMEVKYKKYRLMEIDLRRTHFDRLREAIPETVKTSEIHLELIDYLKRISSHATNIARILLETGNHVESEELSIESEVIEPEVLTKKSKKKKKKK